MRKLILISLLAGVLSAVNAQETPGKNGFNDGFMSDDKTLFEQITKIQKRTDKFNLYLNMQGSFDAKFNDGFERGNFYMRQLRIEAKGNLTPWLSYRYRQRLNRSNDGGSMIDNIPTSIDYAGIGVQPFENFSFFAGKQCAAYGGFEFDLNPIDVYEYCDMIENMSNFMTGLNLSYMVTPSQQLQFQILNSLNSSTYDTYGNNVEASKLPLVYTLNWNGNFNDVFKTRWSASVMREAKGNNMYYFAIGNEVNLGAFNGFLDFMYSSEDLDRKGMITDIVGWNNGHKAVDAQYMSWVLKLNYRVAPKWNIFVKGMYETDRTRKTVEAVNDIGGAYTVEKGKYRTAYGYFAGLEFYPMKTNLHFFLTYVGRSYNFTSRAKALGKENYNTSRLSLGFIYQLPMF